MFISSPFEYKDNKANLIPEFSIPKEAVLALGRTGFKDGIKNPYFYNAEKVTGFFPIGIGDFYAGIKEARILDFVNYNFDYVFSNFRDKENDTLFYPIASALLVEAALKGGNILIKRKNQIYPVQIKAVYIEAQDIQIFPMRILDNHLLGFLQPPFDYHCSAELRQILRRVQIIKCCSIPINVHIIHELGESIIYAFSNMISGAILPYRLSSPLKSNFKKLESQ